MTTAGPATAAPWDVRPVAARVTRASWAVLLMVLVIGPALPAAAGPVVLVTAGLLGLPHGAVDHLALAWSRGRLRARPAVVAVYGGTATAAAAAALAVPGPALALLLVLSAAHFAEGERAYDLLRGGPGSWLPAAALGTAVVSVPLLLHPGAARAVLAPLDPALVPALAAARPVVLALTAALVVAGLVAARQDRRVAGELVLVTLLVLVAPPLVAFGAWFAGWHASRHLVRLAALLPGGDGRSRLRRLARGALLPTAASLAGLLVLASVLGRLPGALLLVLLALTVPHTVVVGRLPRVTGAAQRRPSGAR